MASSSSSSSSPELLHGPVFVSIHIHVLTHMEYVGGLLTILNTFQSGIVYAPRRRDAKEKKCKPNAIQAHRRIRKVSLLPLLRGLQLVNHTSQFLSDAPRLRFKGPAVTAGHSALKWGCNSVPMFRLPFWCASLSSNDSLPPH